MNYSIHYAEECQISEFYLVKQFVERIHVESIVSSWYFENLSGDLIDFPRHHPLYINGSSINRIKNRDILPSKCELIIIKDVPKRLNVITNEPLVRIGPTARNLIISSSGSKMEFLDKWLGSFSIVLPVQNQIKSLRRNIHKDKVPK